MGTLIEEKSPSKYMSLTFTEGSGTLAVPVPEGYALAPTLKVKIYSVTGTLIREFSQPFNPSFCRLSYDRFTDTVIVINYNSPATFYEYTMTGTLVRTITSGVWGSYAGFARNLVNSFTFGTSEQNGRIGIRDIATNTLIRTLDVASVTGIYYGNGYNDCVLFNSTSTTVICNETTVKVTDNPFIFVK